MARPTPPRGRKATQREGNFRQLFSSYRRRARKHNRAFELSPERFRELVTSACFVCGAKPSQRYKHDKHSGEPFIYNGIDRMDNSKGYEDGNCAPCCSKCNYAKGTLSLEEFLLYIYRAYHHAVKPALQEGNPDDAPAETDD